MAATSLVPMLQVHWNGYTPEEVQRRASLRSLDFAVVPLFALWYLVQASAATSASAFEAAAVAPVPSALTAAMRAVLALAAGYVLAVHVLAFPAPTAGQDAFRVQANYGRWVYLTRHCVTLQAWHQILSFASLSSPTLTALTHGMSVWIASLGWFVTVQYFALVYPSKPFEEDCQLWQSRGVHFRELGSVLHAPALPIAVLDLLSGKSAPVLRAAVLVRGTFGIMVVYVLMYLSLMVVNYRAVGVWPYGFMKGLGVDIRKWGTFVAGQIAVLLTFAAANAVLLLWKAYM